MVLSDVEIKEKIRSCSLIKDYNESNIGSSFYELRMSDIYFDLTENNKRIKLEYNDEVIIKPGHRVVLMSLEELNLPLDIMGRVISKGSLFSIGLTPICTNVDPGFKGKVGMVMQNISNSYITFKKNEPIAKVDFCFLKSKASKPYAGQHGFGTEIWPVKNHMQKAHKDLKNDKRIDSEEVEASKIIPPSTANAVKKIMQYQRKNNYAMIFLISLNFCTMLAIHQKFIESLTSFAISMVANILILMYTNNSQKASEHGN